MKKLLLIICSCLGVYIIAINIYRYAFSIGNGYYGIHNFFDSLNSFNPFSNFLSMYADMQRTVSSIQHGNWWDTFTLLFQFFSLPIMVLVDIFSSIAWVLNEIFGINI